MVPPTRVTRQIAEFPRILDRPNRGDETVRVRVPVARVTSAFDTGLLEIFRQNSEVTQVRMKLVTNSELEKIR